MQGTNMAKAELNNLLLLMGGFIAYKLSILLAWNGDALGEPPWSALQPDCFVALFFAWGISTALVLLGAIALLSKRTVSWQLVKRSLAPSFAVALAGVLAFLSLLFSTESLPPLIVAGCILSVGYAALHAVWLIFALRTDVLKLLAVLVLGQVATSLSFMVIKQAGTEVQASFLVAACAVLFATTLALALRSSEEPPLPALFPTGSENPLRNPLVIGIAVSTLGVGILWGSSASIRDYTLWVFGAIAVCVVFFTVALVRKRKADPETLIRLVFAMLGIAILLTAILPDGHAAFMGVVWVGYSILSLCLFLLGRTGNPSGAGRNGVLLAAALAIFDASISIGLALGRAIDVSVPFVETPTTVAVALLLALAFLFSTRSSNRPPLEEAPPSPDIEGINKAIRGRCDAFGASNALTAAECDTLFYLAKGLTIERIADARVVSRNTIKSQITSLYRKAGVHSKQELLRKLDLIDGE